MSLKVFIENNSGAYKRMFVDNGWTVVLDLHEADLVQLEGGADVSPELYGEAKHPSTYSSEEADKYTYQLFQHAQELGIPVAGICRGSQFLSVMGGGKLWQNINGHATGHMHDLLDIESGIIIEGVSSTHHQQHRPADNAIIIATAFPQLATHKSSGVEDCVVGMSVDDVVDGDFYDSLGQDIEAFYYPHINALGCQWHPEFGGKDSPQQEYYFHLIEKYLNLCVKE